MKKKIAMLILLSSVTLVGCGKHGPLNEGTPEFEKGRFEYVETVDKFWTFDMYIIRDKKTGVNYIMTDGYDSTSITPLYDSNGNVVVTE